MATEGRNGMVKRAVKEALDDKRLDDLAQKMTDLATQMAAGFSAVHTRQDTANGKLMAHQARFEKMDGEATGRRGYDAVLWLAFTTLFGAVVGLATWIITHH